MKKILQRLKSKTYWLAGAVGVILPVIEVNMPLIKQYLAANQLGVYIAISVLIGILREVTTTSVSDK